MHSHDSLSFGQLHNIYKLQKCLIIFMVTLLVAFPARVQSSVFVCKKYCNLTNIFYLVTISSAFSSLIYSWYTHYGEKQNEASIKELSQRLDIMRAELDALKSTHAPLHQCLKDSINRYEVNQDNDKEAAVLNIESHLLNGEDHLYYFRYAPDPTVYLLRTGHEDNTIRFEPRSMGAFHFVDCESFRTFLDTVYNAFQKIVSEKNTNREQLFYPVFSLSMKYCGGFIHNDSFSPDHICFHMVSAHLELTAPGQQHSMLRAIYRNPFDKSDADESSIELPVMGSIHSDVKIRSHEMYPHKVWLEKFSVGANFRLNRVRPPLDKPLTTSKSRVWHGFENTMPDAFRTSPLPDGFRPDIHNLPRIERIGGFVGVG